MAYVINDTCVSCGSCAGECPVNAIAQGDGKYEIDADACISCGTCAGVCPTGAISEAALKYESYSSYRAKSPCGIYYCPKGTNVPMMHALIGGMHNEFRCIYEPDNRTF